MKKKYETPVIDLITFDYTVQTSSASQADCYWFVANLDKNGAMNEVCDGEGSTPSYVALAPSAPTSVDN